MAEPPKDLGAAVDYQENPLNPREQLAADLRRIGRDMFNAFVSEPVRTAQKAIPTSDKHYLWQRFALDALLSEMHARVNGHFGYAPQREHGIAMQHFKVYQGLPEEITQLLKNAQGNGQTNDMAFVLNRYNLGVLDGQCTIVELTDTNNPRDIAKKYLFLRTGGDAGELAMDVMDVHEFLQANATEPYIDTSFKGINHNLSIVDVANEAAKVAK